MKKNDIFTFTAPNGVEVTAVCLEEEICVEHFTSPYLCTYIGYAQNRIFVFTTLKHYDGTGEVTENGIRFIKTIVDYAILPEYDRILEDYHHQIDMANDYADKTL